MKKSVPTLFKNKILLIVSMFFLLPVSKTDS